MPASPKKNTGTCGVNTTIKIIVNLNIVIYIFQFCRSQRAYNMFCEMKTLGMPGK